MAEYSQPGDIVTLVAPSGGVTAGTFYLIGSVFVMALVDAAEGANFEGSRKGVFTNAPAATSQAWTQGALLYWDNTNFKFTTASSGNTKQGVAAVAKGSSAALGTVLLIPTI